MTPAHRQFLGVDADATATTIAWCRDGEDREPTVARYPGLELGDAVATCLDDAGIPPESVGFAVAIVEDDQSGVEQRAVQDRLGHAVGHRRVALLGRSYAAAHGAVPAAVAAREARRFEPRRRAAGER